MDKETAKAVKIWEEVFKLEKILGTFFEDYETQLEEIIEEVEDENLETELWDMLNRMDRSLNHDIDEIHLLLLGKKRLD